jgi:phospholipase/carboxylesterase
MLKHKTIPPFSGNPPKHLVILLHGVGDSGAGVIGLGRSWRQGLPDTEFLSPDAPFPCDIAPFGRQWFSLQDRSPAALLAGVQIAAPFLNAFIDGVLASRALPPERLALVGFSQGAMLSLYVAPRRTQSLAGVIGYSGGIIGSDTLPIERKSNPPILLVHGTVDDVVSFGAMARAEEGLKNANLDVTTLARPGLGHSIDDVGLAEGLKFLRKVLA